MRSILFVFIFVLGCWWGIPDSDSREKPAWLSFVPVEFSEETTQLVERPTFIRHPKSQEIPISPELFRVFLEDWELAYRLANALGVKGYEVQKLDLGWKVYLDPRTSVNVIPLFHEKGRSFFLAKGKYQGKVIQNLEARSVFVIEYGSSTGAEDSRETEQKMTVYIKVDSFLMGALARIALPFIGGRMDKKLMTVLRDVQKTAQKIQHDPRGVGQILQESPDFSEKEKQILASFIL